MDTVATAPCPECFTDQPTRDAYGFLAGRFFQDHQDATGGQCINAGAYIGPRLPRPLQAVA